MQIRLVSVAAILLLAAGLARAQRPADLTAPAGSAFYGLTPQFAVSVDGKQVVYVVQTGMAPAMLWVQALDGTPHAIAGTEQASYPFWAPDGESVAFFGGGKLKRIGVRGGTATVLCDAPAGRGGTWNAQNVIVFASGISDPLKKVSASGGDVSAATALDAGRENSHRWPVFLPDGRHFLFWAGGGSTPPAIKIASIDALTSTAVVPADTNGVYFGGHLFFGAHNALMAITFDPDAGRVSGEAISMAEPLSG